MAAAAPGGLSEEDKIVAEWNDLIYEWMISKGQATICALAHIKDGAVFAAAAARPGAKGGAGGSTTTTTSATTTTAAEGDKSADNADDIVHKVYKADYKKPIPQEDGTEKETVIDEPAIIKAAAENLRAPIGLWIAGNKYKIVRSTDSYQQGPFTFKKMFCATSKGGCHVVVTQRGIIIIAIYAENHQSLPAEQAALTFAEYLANNNY